MIPLAFLFFHSAFIYAAWEFYQWNKEDTLKARKGLLRAVNLLMVFSLIVWAIAVMAAVNVSLEYMKTTKKGTMVTTKNPITGTSTQTGAADAAVILVNNEMHKTIVYATNGILGSLGIMGITF